MEEQRWAGGREGCGEYILGTDGKASDGPEMRAILAGSLYRGGGGGLQSRVQKKQEPHCMQPGICVWNAVWTTAGFLLVELWVLDTVALVNSPRCPLHPALWLEDEGTVMIPAGTEQGTRGDSRAAGISKGEMSLTAGGIQGDFALKNQPDFVKERLKLFEILKKEHQLLLAIYDKKGDTSNVITVRVADGKTVEGEAWKTTPYDVAAEISQELAEDTVVAKVNGELWDLDRPLEGDSTLELLLFDNEEAQAVYWHSSAHVLGEAMELYYGGHLGYGPPIEAGFYYDMFLEDRAVSSEELSALENLCKAIIQEKQPFERLEVSKDVLLDMFKYNKFKCRILNEKVNTPTTTVYRGCGNCYEPSPLAVTLPPMMFPLPGVQKHQPSCVSRIHCEGGKQRRSQLSSRAPLDLHGPTGEDLASAHLVTDILHLGTYFPQLSTYSSLTYCTEEYHQRNFTEVLSPNIYNSKLWEASGHWQHYIENMFTFGIEKDTFALKPINCPGHCLMFAHRPRSWREMPIRYADFGVLHRNELSGTLSGLTHVRRFQQDDAHIFCTVEQVMVIPVGPTCENYALQVSSEFFAEGFMADVDLDHSCTLDKKIRNAQLAQYNFILGGGGQCSVSSCGPRSGFPGRPGRQAFRVDHGGRDVRVPENVCLHSQETFMSRITCLSLAGALDVERSQPPAPAGKDPGPTRAFTVVPGAAESTDIPPYVMKCPSNGLCSRLPADCIECKTNFSCVYGKPVTFDCTVKPSVTCVDQDFKPQKSFVLNMTCRFCWQLPEADYECSSSTSCMTVSCPRQRFAANCTVRDHVHCLGNRTFPKMLYCNWTGGYKWSTALALSITLGGFGADRFYLGQWREGLGKLFSFGGLGVWTLIDVLLIGVGYVGPADGSLYI
ncbi:hypothetical protein CB1_000803004 [Camelus ferus]|nr:hypothetical protein CB1_000803004 [Camelus ferus]